jgi:hypothetical protein
MIPDFAWPPNGEAQGYRIEFRRGSRTVLRARAHRARLRVARAQLPNGQYRWLVWRLNRRGLPVGAPLVNAIVRIH